MAAGDITEGSSGYNGKFGWLTVGSSDIEVEAKYTVTGTAATAGKAEFYAFVMKPSFKGCSRYSPVGNTGRSPGLYQLCAGHGPDDLQLQTDITRAEEYVIAYTNNKFEDSTAYPTIPAAVKTAVIILAEAYGEELLRGHGDDEKAKTLTITATRRKQNHRHREAGRQGAARRLCQRRGPLRGDNAYAQNLRRWRK